MWKIQSYLAGNKWMTLIKALTTSVVESIHCQSEYYHWIKPWNAAAPAGPYLTHIVSSFVALFGREEIRRLNCSTMAPLLLLLAFLHVLTATKRVPQSDLCIDVKSECEWDLSCSLAYSKFETDCPNIEKMRPIIFVSNAQTTNPRNCSIVCVKAIEKLKETKKGSGLHTCDCNLDGNCLTLKAHVAKCLMADDVLRTRTSCTLARRNCSRDKHCNKFQNHFLLACNNMISGVGCEDKCLKAQTKLLENEYGKYMFDCECDGITEVFCRGVQANAKQLRCLPGMDGSGTRVFEYRHSTDIIYGEDIRNSSCAPVHSYVLPWTLVLLLTLIM